MKTTAFLSVALAATTGLANCTPNSKTNCPAPKDEAGAAFAMTNEAAGNKVIAFSRSKDGSLTEVGHYATGGRGIGVDFDTQGGLMLDSQKKFLYAVNPGDDLVTVFAVKGSSLHKVQTIYAGDQPLSISLSSKGYAYVLDGSVASTGIFGFKVDKEDGMLTPLTNKTIPLSSPIGVPGDVVFSPDGSTLVVTNKVGSTIDVFAVDGEGKAEGPVTTAASSGFRPFAATFFNKFLYVIESGLPAMMNAAVSSYRLNGGDAPSLSAITKSARNDQTDGCWIVPTPDGKYLYTANFVSGTLSSYSFTPEDGAVKLMDGAAANLGNSSEPVDLAMSKDGAYLYNLLRGTGAIAGFKIQADGSLKQMASLFGEHSGLPVNNGASGLAAY